MNWNDLHLRLRALLHRDREERDLEDELAFHLEMQCQKNLQSGMSETEARRQARRQFGIPAAVKEECRDERRISFFETLWQDARYAARGFRRAPAFAAIVVLTIGLGLGVNTAAFSIFNAYVLRPIAVSDPYSLYQMGFQTRSGQQNWLFSWSQYEQLRTNNPATQEIHAVRGFPMRLNGRQCFAELVTGNYFSMLGVGAARGRMLTPSDSEVPGQGAVMVLSYTAWRNLFGGDEDIVGRKVLVHGYPLKVVGVAREGFGGLGDFPRDFWVPSTMSAQLTGDKQPSLPTSPDLVYLIARLKHGTSESQARALLTALAPRLTSHAPDAQRATAMMLESRATAVHVSLETMLILLPLVVAFALVLVMACANVANLMLARALARQREIGIRLSLGAARSRLVRQLLTESILLALPGAAAGLAISQLAVGVGTRLLLAALPPEFSEFVRVAPLDADLRVLAFMLLAAVVSGVAFGIAPALQATRGGIVQAARGDFAHQFRPNRLRNALVLVQVSGCSFLLICAGLLLRGSNRVAKLETGMDTRETISLEIQEKSRAGVLARLASEPLIRTVAACSALPLGAGFPSARMSVADSRRVSEQRLTTSPYDYVSPEFFRVLGIGLKQGRNFTESEALAGSPVTIVSETFAERFWPGGQAVGQTLQMLPDARSHLTSRTPSTSTQTKVIGVARDVNTAFIDETTNRMLVYFPSHSRTAGTVLLLRVNGDPESARQKIDTALRETLPGAVDGIFKMQSREAARVFPFRIAYWVASALGVLSVLLTISGIYGVLSYLVEQRVREIGVRVALGATASSVVGLVLMQGLRLSGAGIVVGAVLGTGAWRLLASMIPAVRSFDATPFLGGGVLVLIICAVAAVLPSVRASRVQPVNTLRHD